jgi:hypothetical protein
MYILFELPQDDSEITAWALSVLEHELHMWSDQYSIDYNTKIVKYTKRITFDNDKNYSFFALTWQPTTKNFLDFLLNYRLIEPMSRV